MSDKERALEIARGREWFTPDFKMRAPSDMLEGMRQSIADKYRAFMEHPFVQTAEKYPLETAQAVGETAWEGAKALPGMAADAAKWVYENPSKAAGKAVEFGASLSTNPVAMVAWGPGGVLDPTEAHASEIDPELAQQHAMSQEAQLMREGYAGGYAEGGEVREAHGDGKKVIGPLAAAAEAAMAKAAEKVLADKAAKEAERIKLFHGSIEPQLKNLRTNKAIETRGATFHSSNPEVAETFTLPRSYGEPVWYDDFGNEITPGRVYETEIAPRKIYTVPENEAQKFIDDTAFQQKIIDMARQQGHDAVVAKNVLEGIGERYPSDVYAVMDDSIQSILKKNGGATYPLREHTDWEEAHDYEKSGGHLTHMSPDEFLDATPPLKMDDKDIDIIQHFKEQIEKHTKLDPLAISKNGKPNGRHRAHAAKEAGVKKVPVVTWQGKERGGTVVKRAIMLVSKKA